MVMSQFIIVLTSNHNSIIFIKQLVTFSFGSLLLVISVLLLPSNKFTLELRL